MSFKTYNNNEKQITNTTYSSVSFSNPDSVNGGTKLSISYFNKLLVVSIAKKNGETNGYATYDTDNQVSVYISITKAKILYDLIQLMKNDQTMHNVCIETNKGLLMVSDGSEYGCTNPCISISAFDNSSNINTVIYETKNNFYKGAYNYDINNATFTDQYFNNIELEAFENTLFQYYNAATYAVAATVMESSMYKYNALRDRISSIAEKVGAVNTNGSSGGYNNKSSFLNSSQNNSGNGDLNGVPKEYESATFDDIANGMGE